MFLKSLNIFSLQNKDIFSNSLLISFFGLNETIKLINDRID